MVLSLAKILLFCEIPATFPQSLRLPAVELFLHSYDTYPFVLRYHTFRSPKPMVWGGKRYGFAKQKGMYTQPSG